MPVNAAMHRFAFLLCLNLVAWLGPTLVPTHAQACSCLPPPDPHTALANAAVVFEGTVARVEAGTQALQVRFTVTRAWKGVAEETLIVATAQNSAACGNEFIVGRSYLVYATSGPAPDTTPMASLCSRTRPTEAAAEDLAALGPGVVPVDGTKKVDQTPKLASPDASRAGCASCAIGSGNRPFRSYWLLFTVGCGLWLRRARLGRGARSRWTRRA